MRVSTKRQLNGEVFIPSQRRTCQTHCDALGKVVVAEFVDGVTGTDDARPDFQRMTEMARQPDCPFDTIVVHALSRFYRAGPEMDMTIRSLRKKGIRVVSVTQPIGEDPSQAMLRPVIGIFDEYTSLENGENVRRAMRENARQGFWNGTTPPPGYRVVAAEQRGTKTKKKLEIDPATAEIVVAAFDLYLSGPPGAGPLGVKNSVKALNEAGYRSVEDGIVEQDEVKERVATVRAEGEKANAALTRARLQAAPFLVVDAERIALRPAHA